VNRPLRTLTSFRYLPLLVTGLAIVGAGFTIALLAVGISDGQFPIPGADYFYVFDPVGDAVRSGVDPYTITDNARIEFFYAPPWAFAFATISWLPPLAGHLLVAGLEMFALRYIVGSWRVVGIVSLCPLLAFELALGNINLIIGALIVAAARGNVWAGLAGAAAKLSPILAIAPSRAVIRPALVAIALCIPWGPSWIAALIAQLRPADVTHAIGGAQIPVPFVVRGAIAVALLFVRRPWARGTAAIIAIPAFYYQTLLLLVVPLALIRDALTARRPRATEHAATADPVLLAAGR